MAEMDRNAQVLYLRDVRDLEIAMYKLQKEYEELTAKYKLQKERVESSAKASNELENRFIQTQEYLRAEYRKVQERLLSYYDQKVLPAQFRNLEAVSYLYDYMSASSKTLQSAIYSYSLESDRNITSRLNHLFE